MKKLFLVTFFYLMSGAIYAVEQVSYEIAEKSTVNLGKISYRIVLNLHNGELPTKQDIAYISNQIANKHKSLKKIFVHIYLPGMDIHSVSYAFAHHPNMRVTIQDYALEINPPAL